MVKYVFLLDITTTKVNFTGELVPRTRLVRRNTFTKVEGEFISDTTSKSEFVDYSTTVERTTIKKRQDNLTVEGDMTFDTSTTIEYTEKT